MKSGSSRRSFPTWRRAHLDGTLVKLASQLVRRRIAQPLQRRRQFGSDLLCIEILECDRREDGEVLEARQSAEELLEVLAQLRRTHGLQVLPDAVLRE